MCALVPEAQSTKTDILKVKMQGEMPCITYVLALGKNETKSHVKLVTIKMLITTKKLLKGTVHAEINNRRTYQNEPPKAGNIR